MPYDRQTATAEDGSVHVTFTFPTKGGAQITLAVSDYTSGQAMIDAALAWAAKQ